MIVSVRVGAQLDRKVMLLPMAAIHQGASADELMVYEVVVENGRDVVQGEEGVASAASTTTRSRSCPTGSEVQAGSRIVVTTAERLTDGMSVRVMQDNTDSAATLAEAK